MPPILVDTSFLYTLNDLADRNRGKALKFVADRKDDVFVIPQVVLTETAYMLVTHVNERALMNFWDSLSSPRIQLEPVTKSDLVRAKAIRLQYADAHLDFVDCCIMALAERLNISQICTFDRRDFSVFKPSHAEYLELLP